MNIKQIAIDCGAEIRELQKFGGSTEITFELYQLEAFAKAILDIDFPLIGKLLDENAKYKEIIEEQKRTITVLNTCIGGEDSTTTENIRRVDALEIQVMELQSKINELRGALMKFGRHTASCTLLPKWIDADCNCGLREAISATEPYVEIYLQPDYGKDIVESLSKIKEEKL